MEVARFPHGTSAGIFDRESDEERAARYRLDEVAAAGEASLHEFVRAAWPYIVPNPLIDVWHVQAICEHLEAAFRRELSRLVVTVPPGTGKSTLVSVLAPAWRWTHAPSERILSSSWKDEYATRDTRRSRMLMQAPWYRAHWGGRFSLATDENLKTRYSNDQGGYRVAGHVGGGTGERGDVLILDDPHNAQEMHSDAQLLAARQWWGDTWASRLNDSPDRPGVMVVIGQRIHTDDVIGMLLGDGRWTHLCLPARYERMHPFVTPPRVPLRTGREIHGDPREEEGELLAPAALSGERLDELAADMTAHVAAGQLQQRPAPKEGGLLTRRDWRYYPPELSYYRRAGTFGRDQARALAERARFTEVIHTWDTSLKDGAKNDYVAGQAWGVAGANRYLLRLVKQRMGLNATVEAMLDLAEWAHGVWPHLPHRVLIEAAATGPDAAAEIRKRVDGVILVRAKGAKELRAAAAAPALEGHNCFLPGHGLDDLSGYDSRTPADVQAFVESCAEFPNGAHDDDVDAWSQMVNWTRMRGRTRATLGVGSAEVARAGRLAGSSARSGTG